MPVKKRKILVEVGYFDFAFDDLFAANAFAVIAKSHLTNGDEGREVRLTVNYDFEEDQEKDQEEDKEVVYTDTDSIKINVEDEDTEDEDD